MTTTELKDPATTQNDESQNTTASTKKRGTRTDFGLQQQQQDQETFYKNLIAFNERRNTPIVRMPKISGEDVDLHKLYTEVISRGGWLKVNIRNEWEDVLYDLGFSTKCVNGVVALKQIYCRYLDKYEKFYFLGEDPDRPDEPDDDDRQSRHKKWSEKATPIVPMSYNYLQHNVTEQTRIANKMSTDLYKNSEYEKLLLCLMSPLPNDQDFAINVCTLMTNESKHTLRIENCPKLLDALVAHAGVFCHATMRHLFEEYYTKTRKYSLQAFWNDLLYKLPEILELSYEDNTQTNDENVSVRNAKRKNEIECKETFEDGLNADFDDNIEMDNIDYNTLEFLSLGRGLGTSEYIGQRVQQVSSIMRNLSFFEENVVIMAKNRTFIRFLVMCSNIRWGNLHHTALDICGNIAPELDLFDPTADDLTRCLISTLCEGIESQDRGVIISCLEILNKLSQRDTNEDYLLKCLNQKLYNHICLYLSLNDIMLLLYTLECIYSLSSLGSTPCNAFVQVKGIVDTLVSLITVEAQSYGPDGCILMRVVETVPGNMLPIVAQNIANLQNVALAHIKQPQQQQTTIVQTETPQKVPNLPQIPVPANVNTTTTPQQNVSASINLPKQNSQVQQSTSQENEQFAISWLTATLENAPPITNRIEQHELYKLYSAALAKNGKRGSVPQTHFPRIVRSIFGTNIGPTMLKITDSKGVETNMFFYVNLKFRVTPLPLKGFSQASQPIQNQTQAAQQNNQPSQVTQQNVINQTVENKIANSNTSTNQITTQSTSQANSDLVNNLNVEIKSNQQITSTPQQQIQQQSQVQQQPNLQIQQPQVQQQQQIQVQSQPKFQSQPQQQLQYTIQQKSQQQQQQQQFCSQSQINQQKIHQNQILKSQITSQIQPQKQSSEINHQQPQQKMIGNVIITQHSGQVVTKTTTIGQTQMTTTTHVPSSAGGSTAIIKSLLANKVTSASNNNITCSKFTTAPTTQISGSNGSMSTSCAVVKDTIVSAVNTNNPSYLITQNVNLHQLAQRQQTLAKQKEVANQLQGTSVHINNINTPQKLSTTTISALVNNPIIQSTPVKVGQTTIKPINPHTLEKKSIQVPIENMDTSNWDPVPPLAPLGGATVRSIIVPASSLSTASEDSCNSVASSALSTSHVLLNDDGESSLISFDGLLIPKSKSTASSIMEDDSSKDSTIKGSQFINANKMLVNLLDKKSPDPPALTVGIKRKLIEDNKIRKKQLIITQIEESEPHIIPSKNAANLYAEMAASILEDEDLEDVIPPSKMSMNSNNSTIHTISNVASQKQQISQAQQQQQQQQNLQTVIQKPQEPQKQIITMPLHRQIIVSPNVSNQQVILSQNPITVQASQQSQQTITTSGLQQTTIKNDSGLQTVPQTHSVILQKQIGPGGQQIIQPVLQQQPQTQTQYVLATNQQGQTYLVAQQTHTQPQPTVLLTQTSQNQQNAPTKTIIILQQQGGHPQAVGQHQIISGAPGQPQKMIMTTSQGQQMILTQVPRPQILLNQGGNVLPQNVVLTQTVLPQSSSQPHSTIHQIQHAAQQSQLSPRFHIQQTILNSQNQTQGIVPQLTSNGATLQIQQQTAQQQQASILSQLPQIPATIKLHTPTSTTSLNNKPIMQQQNITTKVINKPNTSTISIVAQNPVTTQSSGMQTQIMQQIIKPGEKIINSSLAKVTLQQPQQTSLSSQIAKTQMMTQQHQTQIQKTQSVATIQKSQTIQTQAQLIQQQKLQSTQNQIMSPQSLQHAHSSQNQITIQQQTIQQQKPQTTLQPTPNQHQNIMQQILAQNPSQTQIIQQSPAIQTSTSSIITTQTKPLLTNQSGQTANSNQQLSITPNSNQQLPINSNSNQQINVNSNSNYQTNNLSSMNQQSNLACHQQNGQTQNQTQQSQSTSQNNTNNSNSSTTRNENSNSANNASNNSNMTNSSSTGQSNSPAPPPPPPPLQKNKTDEDIADINYLYVCDWRNCPRKKYKSVQEIYKHACQVHCPEGLDSGAEIYCQWGPGPGFCDNIPRKRFSLMTHLLDRHCTIESMKAAVQRRLVMGIPQPTHANPVTIIKSNEARGSTASPALSTSSSGSAPSGAIVSAAMHAIKRHSTDFINPKELMDENEGPVTKSIRLTAALILRNLVTYTDKAKRHIRQHEPHLAGVALSNVESSRTISQILYELNN